MNLSIDFDAASKAWMLNKIKTGNGTYRYVCGFKKKDGTPCKRRGRCPYHKKSGYSSNPSS